MTVPNYRSTCNCLSIEDQIKNTWGDGRLHKIIALCEAQLKKNAADREREADRVRREKEFERDVAALRKKHGL